MSTTTNTESNTTTPTNSSQSCMGRVKWFNGKKGFGFISVLEGEHTGNDVFVYHEHITVGKEQYRYLVEGEYVTLNIEQKPGDEHEFSASNVRGICNGPLMCETRLQHREENLKHKDTDWETTKKTRRNTSTRGRGRGRGKRQTNSTSHPTRKIET